MNIFPLSSLEISEQNILNNSNNSNNENNLNEVYWNNYSFYSGNQINNDLINNYNQNNQNSNNYINYNSINDKNKNEIFLHKENSNYLNLVRKICNYETKNYLKKTTSAKLERSNPKILLSTFLTDLDILTDIYIKLYQSNYQSNFDYNLMVIVRIENCKFIKIPFSMLKQWMIYENRNMNDTLEYSENYRIPLEILIGEFNLFNVNSNKMKRISVEIHYVKTDYYAHDIFDIVSMGEVFITGKYLHNNLKKSLMDNSLSIPIQVLQSMTIKNTNYSELEIPLHFYGPCKGFILLGEEISEIEELDLYINDVTILSYDRNKINIFCEKITNRMIYVPLDYKLKLKDTSTVSFDSVIYFNNDLEKFDISMKIKCPVQNDLIIMACTMTNYICKNNTYFFYNPEIMNNTKSYKYIVEKGNFAGNKVIDSSKSYCVISQDLIKKGENYAECDTCKNCFLNQHLSTYFDINNVRICPYCRKEWNEIQNYFCNLENNYFIKNKNYGVYLEEISN
jgi:hypothetical protein